MSESIEPIFISSKENLFLKQVRLLTSDNLKYRKISKVWIEGEHLCHALMNHPQYSFEAVFEKTYWESISFDLNKKYSKAAQKIYLLADGLMKNLSTLPSPQAMGFVIDLPTTPVIQALMPSVILDGVQDAGNVGSILRSAAAFGFVQILAIKGTAALWGPKVLRAGMGAHFGLHLIESIDVESIDALTIPILATSSHRGQSLKLSSKISMPCAWLFGHEGQGVREEMCNRATDWIRIDQPGGEESLNVAAAAAICMHASATNTPNLAN
ncbi:MAG: RNA methyltransferase [Limnohabitans sp.]|nr:RNA methyltransferase [Limnohabitans sp.]